MLYGSVRELTNKQIGEIRDNYGVVLQPIELKGRKYGILKKVFMKIDTIKCIMFGDEYLKFYANNDNKEKDDK